VPPLRAKFNSWLPIAVPGALLVDARRGGLTISRRKGQSRSSPKPIQGDAEGQGSVGKLNFAAALRTLRCAGRQTAAGDNP
jgi:hypothetical protein